MPSFTGFYLVIQGFTRFYLVILGFTGFYWVLLGFTGFKWPLPSFTEFYLVLLGFRGTRDRVFTEFYRIRMGFTEFFFTGLYRDGMACRAACVFQKDNWRSLSVSSFIFFLLVSSNERVGSEMAFLASDSGCEPHPQARQFFLNNFFLPSLLGFRAF